MYAFYGGICIVLVGSVVYMELQTIGSVVVMAWKFIWCMFNWIEINETSFKAYLTLLKYKLIELSLFFLWKKKNNQPVVGDIFKSPRKFIDFIGCFAFVCANKNKCDVVCCSWHRHSLCLRHRHRCRRRMNVINYNVK